jgi:hypothetical protein
LFFHDHTCFKNALQFSFVITEPLFLLIKLICLKLFMFISHKRFCIPVGVCRLYGYHPSTCVMSVRHSKVQMVYLPYRNSQQTVCMHISAYSFSVNSKSLASSFSCSSYLKQFWSCEGNIWVGPDPSPNDRLVLA